MSRKLLALMVAAALALVLGACGSSEDEGSSEQGHGNAEARVGSEKPTPVEMVRVAYEETAAEETARMSYDMTMTTPTVDLENDGRAAPMTMRMAGEGVVDFSDAASSLTLGMAGMGGVEMRQVGDTAYIKMPEELRAQMPDAKPWMRVDIDAMYEQQYGASPGQMQGGLSQDPTRQLEYLRGVSDAVEKVGEEEVRGVRTTRYRAVLDLEKEAAKQDPEVRKAYDQLVEQMGTSRIPVNVWLDDQNRTRRFAMDMSVPMPENAPANTPKNAEMRTQMVIDYYDFGTPVDVQAPPANQTMDGSQMMAGQQPAAR